MNGPVIVLGEIMPGFLNNIETISVSNIATSKFAILLYFISLTITNFEKLRTIH